MVTRDSRLTDDRNQNGETPAEQGEDVRSLIRSAGLRCTPQRVTILKTLRGCSHPTAEELHAEVSRELPVSLATVYNTLDVFSSSGIILRMPSRSGCFRYCGAQSSHLHFQITGTNELMDVPGDLGRRVMESMPQGVISEIEERMGVRVDSVDVQFSGSKSGTDQDPDS